MTFFTVERDGQPAADHHLAPLAFAGYAHFTAMQVRGGLVRGLDLHLQRLRDASLALYGQALPEDHIRACLRAALRQGPAEVSLTATVYSPAGEFTVAGPDATPALLVRTSAPADGPAGPLRLASFQHERVLPELKHVGEVAKTWYLRAAAARGYDDAVFRDRHGRLTEGSIWNLAFWDGHCVVWPRGSMLAGTTMQIVRRQLQRLGVPQREQDLTPADVAAFTGAVVMNSWTPAIAVHGIDTIAVPPAPPFLALLRQAWKAEPPTAP